MIETLTWESWLPPVLRTNLLEEPSGLEVHRPRNPLASQLLDQCNGEFLLHGGKSQISLSSGLAI